MIDQKVTIYYNSDFTARAVKLGNWSTHSKGYNFSYPVLNTIDITNLLMSGGEVEISAERMGTSVWSFDLETSTLLITKKDKTQRCEIDDVGELFQAMVDYFNQNNDALMKKSIHSIKGKTVSSKTEAKTEKVEAKEISVPSSQEEQIKYLTDKEADCIAAQIHAPVSCKFLLDHPEFYRLTQEQIQEFLRKHLITKAVANRLAFKGTDLEFYSDLSKDGKAHTLLNYDEYMYFEDLKEGRPI